MQCPEVWTILAAEVWHLPFNEAIHALRMRVERTFAWEDKFKRLLL
jgi:hypothetical protein